MVNIREDYSFYQHDYMLPTNDIVFKKIFGTEGNEDITKDFIGCIIGRNIKKLEFKDPNLLRDYSNDKNKILDVKAVLDDNTLCDIEVQVANEHDIIYRALDYWSKMYRTSIEKSKRYIKMKNTIVIIITGFKIDELKEIEDYHTVYKLVDKKHQKVLTDIFRVDIIEIPKAKQQLKIGEFEGFGNMKGWMNFFINPGREISNMDEMSDELKKAYEEWQKYNSNEEERELAERRYLNLLSHEHAKWYEHNLGIEER